MLGLGLLVASFVEVVVKSRFTPELTQELWIYKQWWDLASAYVLCPA